MSKPSFQWREVNTLLREEYLPAIKEQMFASNASFNYARKPIVTAQWTPKSAPGWKDPDGCITVSYSDAPVDSVGDTTTYTGSLSKNYDGSTVPLTDGSSLVDWR